MATSLGKARAYDLLSDEHFTVDGTLLEVAASLKSFKSKDHQDEPPDDPGNPTVNFHGPKRSNKTRQSTTDPDSMLCRKGKGKEAKLGDSIVVPLHSDRLSRKFSRAGIRELCDV